MSVRNNTFRAGGFALLVGLVAQGCAPDATQPLSPGALSLEEEPVVVAEHSPNLSTNSLTLTPSWKQTTSYDWSVVKTVSPANLTLEQGQSGTFTFTITSTRGPAVTTTAAGGSGTICAKNSSLPTEGLSMRVSLQRLDGSWVEIVNIPVDVSSNPELDKGEQGCYNFTFTLPSAPDPSKQYRAIGWITADNYVTDTGVKVNARTNILPVVFTLTSEEIDESATLNDVMDCSAAVGFTCSSTGFGPITLTGSDQQTFPVTVTNVSAPCNSDYWVVNKASLTENDTNTGHQSSATGNVISPDCKPTVSIHGCTPGYWKQQQHFDSWTAPYDPTDNYDATFGVTLFGSKTLLDVLKTGGGGMYRMGRHSVAALLNSAHPDVMYGPTTTQVIAKVQEAVATRNYDLAGGYFEDLNERGCPLN